MSSAAAQAEPAQTEPKPAETSAQDPGQEAPAEPAAPARPDPSEREKKMIAYRDELRALKEKRLSEQRERREAITKQREQIMADSKATGERRVDVEDQIVQERRQIVAMDATIDRAAQLFARLELLRKYDAERVSWIAEHKASEQKAFLEAERAGQNSAADQTQDAIEAVTSRRTEIKAIIDLFHYNESLIKGEMGKLPAREASAWQDWAYLTEAETQAAAEAAAAKSTAATNRSPSSTGVAPAPAQSRSQTVGDRNAVLPADSLEHKRRMELEDKLDELRSKETMLALRKRNLAAELKSTERDFTGTEAKLRDQLRSSVHKKRDAQRRTQEVIRLNEYILHSCVEDQRQLQKISGVALPGTTAAPANTGAQRNAIEQRRTAKPVDAPPS